jgi:hypothetical protein
LTVAEKELFGTARRGNGRRYGLGRQRTRD